MTASAGQRLQRIRTLAGTLVPLLLLFPVYDSISVAARGLEAAKFIRERSLMAPDAELDQFYGQLTSYLPAHGRVGFTYADPPSTNAIGRALFFLGYSLAPRQVVASVAEEFVISIDHAGKSALLQDPKYATVKDLGDGLRVLRLVR